MTTARVTAAGLAALMLAGCSSTDDFFQRAADRAGEVSKDTKQGFGEAIDAYCTNVPAPARLQLRAQVNEFAERGEVKVTCNVDESD